jgi:uncharacterized protein (DUF305 family)
VIDSLLGVLRRRSVQIGTAAALLGLLAGFALGFITPSLRTPGANSPEAGFARDMSVHHAQAVEMGMQAFAKGTTEDIRTIGYDIALSQQSQIGTMNQWLTQWRLLPTGDQDRMAWMPDGGHGELVDGRMPGMATDEQLTKLKTVTGQAFDILFCQLMLNHHLGGLHMIEGILQLTKNQQVNDLAENMKAAQQNEVELLRQLLARLHAQPLAN